MNRLCVLLFFTATFVHKHPRKIRISVKPLLKKKKSINVRVFRCLPSNNIQSWSDLKKHREMSALKGVLCRENARNEIKHQTTQGRCFSYALGSSPSKTKSSRNKYDDAPPTMEQLRSIGDQTDSLVWSPSNDRLVQL